MLLSVSRFAKAEQPEFHFLPGALVFGGGAGGSIKGSQNVGGSSGFFVMDTFVSYHVTPNVGLIGGVQADVAESQMIRMNAGAQYHIDQLNSPLLPYALLQLSYTRMMNILGADMNWVGARVGLGVDCLIRKNLLGGMLIASHLGSTLSARPAFYGTWEFTAYAGYRLF